MTTEATRTSASDIRRNQALMRDTIPCVVLLVVTQGSLILLDPDGGASAANLLWSLLPLVPAAWLVWAQVRSIRRADDPYAVARAEAADAIRIGDVLELARLVRHLHTRQRRAAGREHAVEQAPPCQQGSALRPHEVGRDRVAGKTGFVD